MIFSFGLAGFSGFQTVTVCMDQNKTLKKLNSNLNFMAIDEALVEQVQYPEEKEEFVTGFEDHSWMHPTVEASEKLNVLTEVFAVLTMGITANGFITRYGSGYYYWLLGSNLGSFIGTTFTAFDRWFSLGIIEPKDPWLRY